MKSRLTIPEVMADLGLGRRAVDKLLSEGSIPALRVGSRWLITRTAYERWKANCGVRTEPVRMIGARAV